MACLRLYPYLLLVLVVSFSPLIRTDAEVSIRLEGFVKRGDGSPLENAVIRLWGFNLEADTTTDEHGYYTLTATTDEPRCTLYAFYDDPQTPSVDLLPAARHIGTVSAVDEQMNFTLIPAATVVVVGQLRPIESAGAIRGYSFQVLDPEEEEVLSFDGYSLIYGTGVNVQSFYLGLNSSVVIVPAGVPFTISVSSAYQYERTRTGRRWYGWYLSRQDIETFTEFEMVEGDHFFLGEGETLQVDVRKYSLKSDLDKVEKLADELMANLTTVEETGFYLTSERRDLQGVEDLTASASLKLAKVEYEDAYIDLRQAYLKAVGVQSRLATVTAEATISVNILIAFVALTAVAFAGLLTEDNVKRLLFTAGLYAPMLLYLYNIYPGSIVVSRIWFAAAGVAAASAALLATSILPMVLGERRSGRGIARLGAPVALFSMAKRNLRRRRLRLVLILTSVLTLTMSFVALTSLSTGYGLIYRRAPSQTPGASGILVRLPEYVPRRVIEEGWFYPLNYMIAEWVSGCDGVTGLSMKAENRPEQRPWAVLDDQPIHGVIGVQPDVEPLMQAIDENLVEGERLREDGTCLISEALLQRPGVDIGDSIEIRGIPLRIVGSFGSGIQDVMDVDGESILPRHQINHAPEARVPILEAVRCEPQTVVITTLDTAVQIRYVFVSRIVAELEPGVDAGTLAKSMALSREYRIWVSDEAGVYLTCMGATIGGKGLSILVPWAIVILSVVATMMNAMYERRGEIAILSSIGLNPIHISGIFLAEASVIGVMGGGIGYLLGLGWYPLMAEMSRAPVVLQKVSAIWCLAALGIAVAAVVSGSVIALKSSIVVTPSLRRRWTVDGKPGSHDEPWTMEMPLKIEEDKLDDFIHFISGSLRRHSSRLLPAYIESMRTTTEERDGGPQHTITFIYSEGQADLRGLKTFNTLAIARAPEGEGYSVELRSKGTREATHRTGSFIRKIIFAWNLKQDIKMTENR